MQKGKTLSFILASLLSLSQIAPGIAISQKAYASTDKIENEITNEIDHNREDGNSDGTDAANSKLNERQNLKTRASQASLSGQQGQNQAKIDIDTSLKIELPDENTYPKGKGQYTKWIFTLKNNSDKSVYLGGISTPPSDNDLSDMISKNINIETFEVDTHGLYKKEYLKNFILDVSFKKADKVEGEKKGRHLGSNIGFYPDKAIYANFKFRKTLEIPAQKSIDIEIWTLFFDKDYLNPFDKKEWVRKDVNDNTCLFNTDHAMSLKVNLYYDKDGEKPINKDNIPEGSKLNDQASGSFQLKAEVGDLSFGNESKNPSEISIKKADENDYKKVSGIAVANANETLRFVVPVKISNANTAYQDALRKANQKQYLINPRFLIEKEADDDSSLEQEFYIRKTADDSLVKLDKTEVTDGEKKYYKLTLPANKTSDFMTEFDFVYDVKFKDSKRTHGLDKKVKLDFDNLGKVIDTKGDLTLELKADYLNAKEEYQVDFDMANHGKIKPQSVKKGQTASEPKKPEADGYLFEGWYADKELTKEFDFTKPITENTTIYAKWAKLFDITYEFVSGSEGKNLPESINDLLKKIENKKYKVGAKVKAPDIKFEPVKADGGTWTFEAWNEKEIVVSENSETNKFTGKWTFAKDNHPQPGKNDPDGKGNDTHNPKPDEGSGENTGHKGVEQSDNPKDTEPDKNKDKDKKDGGKDKPSSGDKDKKDSDKKDSDKKPSLKPADAPKEKVIRVNTDIYRPIPKGYKRVYFDPGKDACLKYNPSFDYGEVIAFDVKETMTFGEAKAEDKGLVIPIAIPKDKSLRFAGWSPKLQADGEFVEGVKYVALYEKIDKDQETSNIKKSDKNSSKKGQDLVKAEDKKDKKNEKLISDGEISKKENAKAQNSLANKAKAQINKYTSPRTGVAGLGLVTGILPYQALAYS